MVKIIGINQLDPISLSFKFHKDMSCFGIVIGIYISPEGLQRVTEGTEGMVQMGGWVGWFLLSLKIG